MSAFSEAELAYLAEEGHLGRLATIDGTGLPHVVPVGWSYNPDRDTIDIGGRDPQEFLATRKVRNIQTNVKVAIVIDDVLPPWQPRAVMVRGPAESIHDDPGGGRAETAVIRITPSEIISWGLDSVRER